MSVARTISFPEGSATIATGAELRESDVWSNAFHAQCKDHRYDAIIEETLDNDFQYQYLVLHDRVGVIRGIQPFFFVRQNLVEGIPGAFRGIVDSIRKAWPKFLTLRVLMVGCAAGEGHLGALNSTDPAWIAQALHQTLPLIARAAKASLIVLKDFSPRYRETLSLFSRNGFVRVPSMPMTRLRLNFANFEDYLSHLSYDTRKSLRRKFRKTERAANIQLEIVNDVTPLLDEIYPLYLAVHERSPMKFEDRKSTRLNSSHVSISYAVFC